MDTFGVAEPAQGLRKAPRRLIGLFGGTFDPIHTGHLRMAEEVIEATAMDELRLVPCRVPPHRAEPFESAENRAAMIEAALVGGNPRICLDRRELERSGPSFMVDTLQSLRAEMGDTPALALVLGSDAFECLPSWSRWTQLPSLCHLLILKRPGFQDLATPEWLKPLAVTPLESPQDLRQSAAGRLFWLPLSQLDISSTQIRQRIHAGQSIRYLLPEAVLALIEKRAFYRDPPPRHSA